MKYLLLIVFLLSLASGVCAQETFTDYLQRKVAGKGTVVIYQDLAIKNRVNGTEKKRTVPDSTGEKQAEVPKPSVQGDLDTATSSVAKRKYGKVQGYRIQIYAGGNSRNARREAEQIGVKCQAHFPDLAVYTHFLPPRWVCRVGDFRTYEDANAYMLQMREKNLFREATIVKSTVVVLL